MNNELSLAISTFTSAGRSARSVGSMARTPAESSSGFAVAWRTTPTEIAERPLMRTLLRSLAGPSSTRATSERRTAKPLAWRMTMAANCSGRCRSVCAVTLNSRWSDSMRPAGSSRLARRMASSTSCVVSW